MSNLLHVFKKSVVAAIGFVMLSRLCASAQSSSTTIGSGALGFADGSASIASFIEPLGLAGDGKGNVIVADAGAQRIRSIDRSGNVTTIAGSGNIDGLGLAVSGGYADGQANKARFNRPTSVAVGKDGAIYIADTNNHCIRLLKNGVVSTYSGAPNLTGGGNGKLSSASFSFPRSLAFSSDGNLYVADWSQGLRMISPSGVVSTIALPAIIGLNVLTVSVGGTSLNQRLFVSNGIQTYVRDLHTGEIGFYSHNPSDVLDSTGLQGNVEGGEGTGRPVTLLALSPSELLYSDTENDVVRYINQRFDIALDLPGDISLQSPVGLAMLPSGAVVIADAGHRRVIKVPGPDRRSYQLENGFPPPIPAGRYRIALMGNSYVDYNVRFRDSIAAKVEARLDASAGRSFEVMPVRFSSFAGERDYSKLVLASGLTDAAVLVIEANTIYVAYNVPYWSDLSKQTSLWEAPFIADLKDIAKSLSDAHIPLIVVTHPVASEVGPLERVAGFEREGRGIDASSQSNSEASLQNAVDQLHLPCTLDLQQAFVEREAESPHVRLFENADFHFSSDGNAFVADQIEGLLEKCAPWRDGKLSPQSRGR